MSSENRYQNQTRLVKLYRWLRWKPWYACVLLWRTMAWIASGAKPAQWMNQDGSISEQDTRRETLAILWSCTQAECDTKMNHYYTMEEVFGDLDDDDDKEPHP